MNFYKNYLKLCANAGKSASAAAKEIGVSHSAVNRWKNGSVPRDVVLMKIADYFGITFEEIIEIAK